MPPAPAATAPPCANVRTFSRASRAATARRFTVPTTCSRVLLTRTAPLAVGCACTRAMAEPPPTTTSATTATAAAARRARPVCVQLLIGHPSQVTRHRNPNRRRYSLGTADTRGAAASAGSFHPPPSQTPLLIRVCPDFGRTADGYGEHGSSDG